MNDTSIGVWLFSSANCIVRFNQITSTTTDALVDEYSSGGNAITNNTVNEADEGVYQLDSSGDTLAPNTLFNVTVTEDPGTKAIPSPPSTKG